MNPQQHFAKMLVAMSDDAWKVVIVNEVDAMPEQLDFATPECVGRLDAEENLDCDPTRHGFRTVLETEAYVAGWRAVVELEDLIDARENEDFIRYGGS